MDEYTKGIAFIFEGETEKEFYMAFLKHLCKKHNATIERTLVASGTEIIYELTREGGITFLIKFHTVNTISQMPRAGIWFHSECLDNNKPMEWYVFLCYDMDDYKGDVSKFYEGDWSALRSALEEAASVVDIAAEADIEDIMLQDLPHICEYLNCEIPVSLKGRKGKVKMKNLFRDHKQSYHEGKRARPIIEVLDMELLLNISKVPLKEIEKVIFD